MILPHFDTTWFASQLFWLVVIFVLFHLAFTSMVLPKLQKVFDLRRKRLDTDLSEAARLRDETTGARNAYDAAMQFARAKAQELISQATHSAVSATAARTADLDEALGARLAEGEARIHAARNRATEHLVPVATEIAEAVVRKVLSAPVERLGVALAVAQAAKEEA